MSSVLFKENVSIKSLPTLLVTRTLEIQSAVYPMIKIWNYLQMIHVIDLYQLVEAFLTDFDIIFFVFMLFAQVVFLNLVDL